MALKRIWAFASHRALGFVLCLLLCLSSCAHSYRPLPPVTSSNDVLGKATSIRVLMCTGEAHEFTGGRIIGETFRGQTAAGTTEEIPLGEISYFEIKQVDGGKSTALVLGGLAAVVLVGQGIIAATLSCPHVYAGCGSEWILDGEPYPGATARPAQAVDYELLESARPNGGQYELLLCNESDEIDYTDEIKLVVADADSALELVPDRQGGILAVRDWQLPFSLQTGDGTELRSRMTATGDLFWDGNPLSADLEGSRPRESLILSFTPPVGARIARFLLEGNNTPWSQWALGEFLGRYGPAAQERFTRLDADPAAREKIDRFMIENGARIEVQLPAGQAWETVGHIPEVGFWVARTQALEFPVPPEVGDTLTIRLQWAPTQWNILRLGMEFDPTPEQVRCQEIAPVRAWDTEIGDVTARLRSRDGHYYRAEKGAEAHLTFPEPASVPGLRRTVFLKSSGYYQPVLRVDGGLHGLAALLELVKRQSMDSYTLDLFRRELQRVRSQ